jgi:3-dehydroquinate synthase
MSERKIHTLSTGLAVASPYYLGEGILKEFPRHLEPFEHDRIFLVTSLPLLDRFGRDFSRMLDGAGIPNRIVTIEEGEANKSWRTLSGLCERLVEAGVTRSSILLALGGGVVGNVVGLAAGLTYRGIRYIEVPTTMMAQTDGALSNKQAINGQAGKNQFGLYHAPLFVWADVAYLRQEPARQIKSAIVEGVKNGLVNDEVWLEVLASYLRDGMETIQERLEELTLDLIRSKLAILAKDPTEKRDAIVLEYGHTFGHAIEWLARGSLYHGEAVGIGMCIAARLSHGLGILSREGVERHYHLLGDLLGTVVELPPGIDPAGVCQVMLADNKRTGPDLRCLLLEDLGRPYRFQGDYLVRVSEREALGAMVRPAGARFGGGAAA